MDFMLVQDIQWDIYNSTEAYTDKLHMVTSMQFDSTVASLQLTVHCICILKGKKVTPWKKVTALNVRGDYPIYHRNLNTYL